MYGALLVSYGIRVRVDDRPLRDPIVFAEYARYSSYFVIVWIISFAVLQLYSTKTYGRKFYQLVRVTGGALVGVATIIIASFVLDSTLFPARLVPLYALGLSVVFVMFGRVTFDLIRLFLLRRGIGARRVLLIGSGTPAAKLYDFLRSNDNEFVLAGFAGTKIGTKLPKSVPQWRSPSKAIAEANPADYDDVLQAHWFDDAQLNSEILWLAQNNHLGFRIHPREPSQLRAHVDMHIVNGVPMFEVQQTPLIGWWKVVKRIIDIFGSLIGLIISLPVIAVLAIIIKISDPEGGVFYKHKRLTRYGQEFYVYKLRSMYQRYSSGKKTDEEIFHEMGRADLVKEFKKHQKVDDDPRIMPIGKFTRATSLDELPQLFNVLVGELSLVGPRPIVEDELKHYRDTAPAFLSIKPGLSGLWQVSGRNDLTYEERTELELYYVQNWTLLLDIKIILKTIWVVFARTGK